MTLPAEVPSSISSSLSNLRNFAVKKYPALIVKFYKSNSCIYKVFIDVIL